jgi:hypothetical protein
MRTYLKVLSFLAVLLSSPWASATKSAELLTAESYGYGRVEARVRFAPGDGVVSSAFLWKDGSERAGTFWNELDFEKLGADCRLETNPIYGKPASNHSQRHALALDLCAEFHTYTYEWTPEAIVWLVDDVEIRRETGVIAQAFAENASGGMQIHFNLWPGDVSFGGKFDPAIVPVHEYVDWVQFSTYEDGAFELAWREDFDAATLPAGWLTGNWPSPKNKSTHAPENVNFIDGYAVLSLTADDALGPAGAMPEGSGGTRSDAEGPTGTSGAMSAAGSSGYPPRSGAGCSFGVGPGQSTGLGPLGALAFALLHCRARRRDRRRAGASAGESR